MRGLAAVAVVFYHTYIILRQPEYGGNEIFASFAKHGLLGVNFFFILSGFIILLAHRKDVGQPEKAPRYLYRRAVRLYPAYWVFLTAYIAASGIGLGYPDFAWEGLNLASAYFLIELTNPVSLPLKVAWTLFYEIKFYLIFVLLIFSRRLGIAVFALWMAAVVVAFFLGIKDNFGLLSPWNIYFVFGMAVYLLLDRLETRWGTPIFLAGVVMVALYAMNFNLSMGELKSEFEYVLFWLAPAFALLILGMVLIERHWGLRMPKSLMFLGDASYSIYLVHSAAISVLALLATNLGIVAMLNPYVLFFGLFVSASVVGIVAYLVVERPLLELLRNRFFGPSTMQPGLALRR